MASTHNLTLLPVDILFLILDDLDWRSLLACTTVCTTFYEIVQSTAAFQYKIDLGCAGLADCGPRSHARPSFQRADALRRHIAAWKDLRCSRMHTMSLPGNEGWAYELQGGVYARTLLNDDIAWHNTDVLLARMPSALRRHDAEIRTHKLDIDVHDFSLDPGQDLLVLFERAPMLPTTSVVRIHLRSMSDLRGHPSAEHPLLEHDLKWIRLPLGWQLHCIQVTDNLLAVLFEPINQHERRKVVIWNWRTGLTVAELTADTERSLDSFALLSSDALLVASSATMTIDVFVFGGPHANGMTQTEACVHIAVFSLPRLAQNRRIGRIMVRSDPPTSCCAYDAPTLAGSSSMHGSHFHSAEGARVLCFVINIYDTTGFQRPTIQLFTPLSSFMPSSSDMCEWRAQIAISPAAVPWNKMRIVPWASWGPKYTRAIPDVARNSFVTFLHGWRFVMATNEEIDEWFHENEVEHKITVLDFNPLSIRRDLQTGLRSRSAIIHAATRLPGDEYFGREDIFTALPYRCTTIGPHGPYEALMIDDERIIGVRGGSSGNLDTLDVFQIEGLPEPNSGR